MTERIDKRIQYWNTKSKGYSKEEIQMFEKEFEFSIPKEYRELLAKYGKISHTNYWYYYQSLNDNSEYLLDSSISLDDHKGSIEFYWNDLVDSNPNLRKHLYLPIFSTHSPSFFFLIGMDDETFGKIFEYDSDFEDFVPKEIASNFNDFFEDKIYCKFSVHSKAKFGAIEIFRHNGVEIWDVTSSHLSITNINGIKSLNFWVESDHVHLEELEDTGDTSIMFEIKFPISMIADFSNPWKFDYPLFEEISDEWGEESNLKYYDNFYYYSHESFDKQSIEIVKSLNSYFYVRIKGEKDDPLSAEYGKAKFNITVRTKMENKFNGLWCEE